jgi:uncharacterized protein (DUF1015 family)
MAQIFPIQAVHYSPERVELSKVIAPPYDVLSEAQQEDLYARHPENIVRLILNRQEPGDGETDRYQRAAAWLNAALHSGVLVENEEPALYLYQQQFTHPVTRQIITRQGFFCAVELRPYEDGVVLPHEETRSKAKADRLQLMQATRCNPEPIFGLYDDPEGITMELLQKAAVPMLEAELDGDRHRVLRVADPDVVSAVQKVTAEGPIWIADGHHRYETGLNYRSLRREAEGHPKELQPYDTLLIVLTPFSEPGLVVLPTFRLVRNISAEKMEQLPLLLERFFIVQPSPPEKLAERTAVPGARRFGMRTPNGAFVLTLKDESVMQTAAEEHGPAWRSLDVSVLQALVLDRTLGIEASQLATTPDIGYTRDWSEAELGVASGEWQLAFFLNDPAKDEVRRVAAEGDKMPPKSTFFYPKVFSGLILRRV